MMGKMAERIWGLAVFTAFALLTAAAMAGGCAGRAAAIPATATEEDVRIQVGQTRAFEAEALEIAFDEVTSDSRCPKGETCVSEGDAVAVFAIAAAGHPPARLELHTATKMPSAVGYGDWSIRLEALEPYPVTGRTILPTAYVATISVSRGGEADVATR
jgi:hypothetical protein